MSSPGAFGKPWRSTRKEKVGNLWISVLKIPSCGILHWCNKPNPDKLMKLGLISAKQFLGDSQGKKTGKKSHGRAMSQVSNIL